MSGNVELRRLSRNAIHGRIKTKQGHVSECKGSKEFDKQFRLLMFHTSSPSIYIKKLRTEIKLNGSLTMTAEQQQNQSLVFTFSIVMANVAQREGSSRMMCCKLHMHLDT